MLTTLGSVCLAMLAVAGPVLVDLPIPGYPPIAQSAMVAGDIVVNVDVRQDGTVASAVLVPGKAGDAPAMPLLADPALNAARLAQFRCDGCGEGTTPYSLVFAFRFRHTIGRADNDTHPEIVPVSPSRSRILIVAEAPIAGEGPMATRPRRFTVRCLWLWRCENLDHYDGGPAELMLWKTPRPEYPAAARRELASGDVEVGVTVRRDGTVAAANIVAVSNLTGANQEVESGFRQAALAAARDTTFVCSNCRRGTLPYSLVYAFRFDGVLALYLDYGFAGGGWDRSSTRARMLAPADVPILNAALDVRPATLAPACGLAADPSPVSPAVPSVRASVTAPAPASPYELQLAEAIQHAYAAAYVGRDGDRTAVYGLLFGNELDAKAFLELAPHAGSRTFIVHRQIVVAVRGDGACADHLGALLRTSNSARQ